jgi:hypothetical protein
MATIEEQIKELETERQSQTDEYYAREQVIETLSNVLESQRAGTTYVAPAPVPKPTNYVLYIGVAIALFFLIKK